MRGRAVDADNPAGETSAEQALNALSTDDAGTFCHGAPVTSAIQMEFPSRVAPNMGHLPFNELPEWERKFMLFAPKWGAALCRRDLGPGVGLLRTCRPLSRL